RLLLAAKPPINSDQRRPRRVDGCGNNLAFSGMDLPANIFFTNCCSQASQPGTEQCESAWLGRRRADNCSAASNRPIHLRKSVRAHNRIALYSAAPENVARDVKNLGTVGHCACVCPSDRTRE